jgi:hypothetical protein
VKKLLLFISVLLSICIASGKIVTINSTDSRFFTSNKHFGYAIDKYVDTSLRFKDTLVINLKNGTYYPDTMVVARCNVILQGESKNNTIIQVPYNIKFGDDFILGFWGDTSRYINVAVRNLSVKVNGLQNPGDDGRYLFKFMLANSMDFHDVNTILKDTKCTNLNMRECSNVDVRDCEFINYNDAAYKGGCLWIEGTTHNLNIHDNTFRKHGNDEIIAVYYRNTWKNEQTIIEKKDIKIHDNKFYYGEDGNNTEYTNDILVSVIDGGDLISVNGVTTPVHYTISNYEFSDNDFYISDLVRRCFWAKIDKNVDINDFKVANNRINYYKFAYSGTEYVHDICITDSSNLKNVFDVCGNVFRSNDSIWDKGFHSCLCVDNAKVRFNGNTIDAKSGQTILYVGHKGGDVTMKNNIGNNLFKIGSIEQQDSVLKMKITATGNYFSGNTRIYNNKLKNAEYDFRNNTFRSNYVELFLQNFAKSGSLIFNDNVVNVNSSYNYGKLYVSYGSDGTYDSFDKVLVRNNTYNVARTELYNSFPAGTDTIISGNQYSGSKD